MLKKYSLIGSVLITPRKIVKNAEFIINDNIIESMGKKAKYHLNLKNDSYIYPAMINVHDHLRGDYLPKVGPKANTFYLKCHDWEKDLRKSAAKERAKVSEKDCYFLGAYKNLFSGVTTVNDHYPHRINDKYIPDLPVRVIKDYTLHHEATSYSLNWGDGIVVEHKLAKKKNWPFIVHLEEGFDEEYQHGVEMLEQKKALDEYGVLIHCIGFSDTDIKKTKKAGSTVAWCPASNVFMYNLTCKIRKILKAGINVALGTDSTATGSINLLEEMRFARRIYRKMYGEDLGAKEIVKMVTGNPANAFRMHDKIGSLEEKKYADLLVINPRHEDPYEALVQTQIEDIELLVIEGKPIYGSTKFEELFNLKEVEYKEVTINKKKKLVQGDPIKLLKKIRKAVGYKKVLDFMPIDI